MRLGKLKPCQNKIWPRTSRATRKASIGMSAIKARLGKRWALSGRTWETWLAGIWRRLRYSTTFFASVFTGSSHIAQVAGGKGRDWENEEPSTVED